MWTGLKKSEPIAICDSRKMRLGMTELSRTLTLTGVGCVVLSAAQPPMLCAVLFVITTIIFKIYLEILMISYCLNKINYKLFI